jgi:fibronectin-binding autotransporter adhesin
VNNRKSIRGRAAVLLAGASSLALLLAAAPALAGTTIDNATEVVPTDHPSPWNVDNGLSIGPSGTGELDVISGGDVTANNCSTTFLGFNAGGKGTLKVDGAGSTFNTGSCGMIAGWAGQGVVQITNGGVMTTGPNPSGNFLASNVGSVGTVTIDGAGSQWNFTGLGTGSGQGTINVTNGGLLNHTNCVNITIGSGSAGKGTINVSGAGSHWANGGGVCGAFIGGDGEGTINVSSGGLVDGLIQIVLGENTASSKGTLTVNGGTLTTSGLIAGEFGIGIVSVSGGGVLTTTTSSDLADQTGSNATGTVDGAGSKWLTPSGSMLVARSGVASLTVTNGGVVASSTGGVSGSGANGTVLISGAGSAWNVTNAFGVGASNAISTITVNSGGVLTDGSGTLGGGSNSTTHMTVTGTGSAWTNATTLTLNGSTNAVTTLDILAGASVSDTTADIQKGAVTVDGAGSTWTSSGNVKVGSSATGTVVLTNGGVMSVGGGSGVLNLGFGSSSNGTLGIGGIAGATTPGTLQAGSIVIGANNGGQGTVVFSHASGNYNFAIPMSGPGQVKFEHGATNLSGTHTYTGATTVEGGSTLNLLGSLGNTSVTVQFAGFLQGTGSIGGNVSVINLGRIVGVGGQTLTMGGLTLGSDAVIPVTLGAPTATPLFQVNGNLTLDGLLQITNAGAFGPGVYRLFSYTGTLTDNTLDFNQIPAGVPLASLSIQTGTAGQVNLVYAGAGLTQYWNGGVTAPNGSVNGGGGTWNTATTNWTNAGGNAVAAWGNGFGIFTATPGAVTIAAGGVSADGAQFAVNGYTVGGGTLTLTNGSPTLRVGDGTAGGAAMTATISSAIAGSNGLIKTDLGTLVLAGTNTYTGGTTINAGVLQIGSDGNLGAAAGGVTLNGGGLKLTPGVYAMGRTLTVQAGGGTIDLAPGAQLDLNGQLTGTGALSRTDSGLLRIQGGGSYSGVLTNQAGILAIGSNLPNANIVVASGASLQGNSTVGGAVHVLNGGEIDGFNGQVFTVGSLTLDANAQVFMRLGAPSNSALIQVNGALVLDGTLTLGSVAGFGPGLYRLFNYTGALTDNGLVFGAIPAGTQLSDLSVQTSVAGQINLVYSAGPIQFWNGSHTTANGTINGGTGTWKIGTTNWTDTAGANAGAWTNGQFAIFSGASGAVTVDNSGGAVSASGVQFAVNGYSMTGGALTLTGATPNIRVGDGTAGGAAMTATVSAPLAGAGAVTKTDLGNLVLSGANSFTGGLDIQAGVVSVAADNNLGGAAGAITLSGGKLTDTGSFSTGRTVTVTALSGLDVASGQTLTLSGALNGSANLIKGGAGTLTFNGAGGYTGAVGVTAGSLVVGGTLSGGGVSVSPGAALGGSGTINGAVTMSDGSHLLGAAGQVLTMGPLLLTDATNLDVTLGAPSNSALFSVHSGLTLDGHLNVTDAGGFGLGVYRLIDYTGALTNNGLTIGAVPAGVPAGNLSVQTAVAGQVNLVYSAAAPILFWNGSHTSPNGVVNGGDGTWQLGTTNWTDANGSSSSAWNGLDAVFMGQAGVVTVDNSGGQVAVGNIQFAGTGYSVGGGGLLLTGAPTTIRVGDGTAAGASFNAVVVSSLSGSGGLVKTDLGVLSLLGANTFTGGLTILGGTVSVGADNNLGAAAGGVTLNGGALSATASFTSGRTITVTGGLINTSSGVTLDLTGALTGAGSLTKGGSGILRISGNSSGYGGVLGVSGGTLRVDGILGGSVVVSSGARLNGIGQVGSTTVASGGAMAPGNSIGTITVAGNLTLSGGSTYEVELNAAGQADLTHATGTVTLQSGVETAMPAAGTNYALGTRYTVITADGGLSGTFGTFNGSALSQPFLKLAPAYDATHAYIDVVRNGASFCSVANTFNQCAAAGGAESLGQGNAVYNAVANLPDAASARAAFDGLSGEAYASVRGVMTDDSRFVRDAAQGRLEMAGSDDRAGWGQVFGADGHRNGDGNAARIARSTGGFLMGGDWATGSDTRLGVVAGYSRSTVKVSARASSGDVSSFHLGGYGRHLAGAWRMSFGAAYAWQDISLDRHSAFGGTPSASARAGTGQVFGEIGYRFGSDDNNVTPFLGLAAVSTHADAFTETGGATALKGLAGTTETTFTTVGLRGGWTKTAETGTVSLKGVVAWRGASGDTTPDARMAFASGGSAFTVKGAPIGDSALVLGADLGFDIGGRGRASLTYDGVFADGVQDQSVKAALKIAF